MRHAQRWLAVLRLTVGLWFLKSLFTKVSVGLIAGFIPVPVASDRWIATMPQLIARYAADNPFPAYKAFLLGTVVPNHAFARLTALGEAAVGISLSSDCSRKWVRRAARCRTLCTGSRCSI